jgi:hypothetical protein
MSCEKHKLRKRKDCPDCFPNGDTVFRVGATLPENLSEKAIEQLTTGTCPQVAIDLAEKVSDHLLKNKLEKKGLKIVPIEDPIAEKLTEILIEGFDPGLPIGHDGLIQQVPNLDDYYAFKTDEIKKQLDEILASKVKSLTKEINSIVSIKYEALDIPLTRFSLKVLDSLLNDGWKMISILTKEVAKVSGLKEDGVIFQRIRCTSWKKTLEQCKELYKGTK